MAAVNPYPYKPISQAEYLTKRPPTIDDEKSSVAVASDRSLMEGLNSLLKECEKVSEYVKGQLDKWQKEETALSKCPEPTLTDKVFSGSLKKGQYYARLQEKAQFIQEKLEQYPHLYQSYNQTASLASKMIAKQSFIKKESFARLDRLISRYKQRASVLIQIEYLPLQSVCLNIKKTISQINSSVESLFRCMHCMHVKLNDLCRDGVRATDILATDKNYVFKCGNKSFELTSCVHLNRTFNDLSDLNAEAADSLEEPAPFIIHKDLELAVLFTKEFASIRDRILAEQENDAREWVMGRLNRDIFWVD